MKRSHLYTVLTAVLIVGALVSTLFVLKRGGATAAKLSGTIYAADALPLADGNLSIIDASTNQIVKRLLVGDASTGLQINCLAASNDDSKIYTVGYPIRQSNPSYTLYSISAATRAVVTSIALPAGETPGTLVTDPRNPFVYVLSNDLNHNGVVTVVSTTSDSIVNSFSLPTGSTIFSEGNAIVDTTGSNLYIIVETPDITHATTSFGVAVFSLAQDAVTDTITFPSSNNWEPTDEVHGIGLSSDNSQLYAQVGGSYIAVFNLSANTTVNQIPFPSSGAFMQTPDRRLMYGVTADAVMTIDTSKSYVGSVTSIQPQPIFGAGGFQQEAISPDGSTIYLPAPYDDGIAVYSTRTMSLATVIPAGARNAALLFLP